MSASHARTWFGSSFSVVSVRFWCVTPCDWDSVKAPEVAESASPGAFQGWEDASIWGDGHQGIVYPYPAVPQDKEALIMVR